MKMRLSLAFAAIMSALAVSSQAGAAGVVIGGPGDPANGNCFPFGCTFQGPEYQQVYAAGDFSGPITISEITFYNHNSTPGTPNVGDFQISLSTTSTGVDSLDHSNLSNNLGGNNTVVFSGALPAVAGGELDISLSTPFTYNPGSGNLLIDVYSSNGIASGLYLDARNGSGEGLFSRTYTNSGGLYENGWGLVTGFNTVAGVPEPATWAMLILGLAMVGAAARRRHAGPALAA